MFKMMDKKIVPILRSKYLLILTYAIVCFDVIITIFENIPIVIVAFDVGLVLIWSSLLNGQ